VRTNSPRSTIWCIAVVVGIEPTLVSQERPLPDPEPFLREVRLRLETDASRQLGYSYVETQRRISLDRQGQRREEPATVLESYPGLPGEDRWERVTQREGKAVPDAELRAKDDDRRRKAERYARRVVDSSERAKIEREHAQARRERAAMVDDVFAVYDIAMTGRERIEGQDAIAFTLTPRASARPRTREGRLLKSFRGRAWVSETDFELTRLDVEVVGPVSIGLGLLARVNRGTTASFTRRKVNDEAWLPARAEYQVNARVLLLKRFKEGGVSEFSNYRRFTVGTETTVELPPASAGPR
jgi:hypothetical protein